MVLKFVVFMDYELEFMNLIWNICGNLFLSSLLGTTLTSALEKPNEFKLTK